MSRQLNVTERASEQKSWHRKTYATANAEEALSAFSHAAITSGPER